MHDRLECLGHLGETELHENGGAHLVGVLDFRLGKRRVAMRAPVDGLATTVNGTRKIEFLEDLDIARLVLGSEGEIGVVPITCHAKALEALALTIDLLFRVLAADLAEGRHIDLGHLLGTEFFLHLVLDGQAMAIPAGNVRCIVPALRVILDDDVLEDLIEGMA